MISFLFSRSITWPFGFHSNHKPISILDKKDENPTNLDASPPLISNRDLALNSDLSKNMDEKKSLIDTDRITTLPSPDVLTVLGKHYLTREDLERLIQARFQQETPRDRIERFLWKE
jgi:hypothetical protein